MTVSDNIEVTVSDTTDVTVTGSGTLQLQPAEIGHTAVVYSGSVRLRRAIGRTVEVLPEAAGRASAPRIGFHGPKATKATTACALALTKKKFFMITTEIGTERVEELQKCERLTRILGYVV